MNRFDARQSIQIYKTRHTPFNQAGRGASVAPPPQRKNSRAAREEALRQKQASERRTREIIGVSLIALGVFLALTHLSATGIVGEKISGFTFGLSGMVAYILPYLVIAQGIYAIATAGKRAALPRFMLLVGIALSILSFLHVFVVDTISAGDYSSFLWASFTAGESVATGGGLLGALFSYPAVYCLGKGGVLSFSVRLSLPRSWS